MFKSNLKFKVRTFESYDFTWSRSDEEYLCTLRTRFNLEDLVRNCNTDIEKILNVSNWVHGLFKHDGINEPLKSDPISILEEVEQGKSFRCVEYSIIINGCLNAVGISSRLLSLKTQDCETREYSAGHVVVEAYSKENNKWIMIDGQWDIIPTINAIPLNAVELQKAIAEKNENLRLLSLSGITKEYVNWIFQYLFYFSCPFDNRVTSDFDFHGQRLMLVPCGALKPTIFQKRIPLKNVTYTNCIYSFYPKLS